MAFAPQIEGVVAVRSSSEQFVAAFRQRVAAGLLLGRPHPRSQYRVVESGSDGLRVRAATYWTAINVGLNDVVLRFPRPGAVHFCVRYWRWAAYVIGLCAILGLIGGVMLLTFDVRGYMARELTSRLPGFSVDQNVRIAWGMVIFWGFVWPWLLIALHKRPVRRLIERLILEVDARAFNEIKEGMR